ncbi:hypothetical protein [Clostridium grantii]|uniref:Uncharacterized protein n=1 Tax=Clostridium grantii DSM 8605 TaxID=1121316 RepID=A0A1M5S8T4_9CLOT|nr:hypothetical protein [Clostridium grantii]SHH34678.1 hypothetical protein SAMN02745207_00805 [Clostridium grantii DSM 8605]
MKQVSEAEYSKEIITKVDSMLKNCPLDTMYFNVIFTEKEIILDFVNRSFRTWLLRIKPYKALEYEGIDIATIKKRNEENLIIKYKDIKNIKLSDRTFFKNSYMEITAEGLDEKLRLFSRNKICFQQDNDLLKEVLLNKIEFN